MTVLLFLAIFALGGVYGLFFGCKLGMGSRSELLDELEDTKNDLDEAYDEIGRLRARLSAWG